jgi:hypothetical protein
MVGAHGRETGKNKEGEVNNKQAICCSHFKSDTHQHRTGKLCAMNPNNISGNEADYEKAKKCARVSVTPNRTVYHPSGNFSAPVILASTN